VQLHFDEHFLAKMFSFMHHLVLLFLLFHSFHCINAFSSNNKNDHSSQQQQQPQYKIAFVMGNEMKAMEMNLILEKHGTIQEGMSLVSLCLIQVDLPEIQEVLTQAIAKEKALLGTQLVGGPCVVDDTSLEFHALGGMPGPYIKWFQESLKSEGLWNILAAYDDKMVTALCTLAFYPYPHADPVLFTGIMTGTIVAPVQGRGFGWLSIFVPKDSEIKFSQMSTEEKNKVSHRGKAVQAWADWLSINKNELYERQSGRPSSPSIGHKGLDFNMSFAEE
jgi:inosine triphosphate pyrophosphatase